MLGNNIKKYVIANWKMKLSHEQGLRLARDMVDRYKPLDNLEVVLCPSFNSLSQVGEYLEDSGIKLGAQNCFFHDSGSYTGEISPEVLHEIGCQYVIIGHSERRKLGETDDDVNRKVAAALKHNLIPIICVGETFEEYQKEKTDVVIIKQVTKALEDIVLNQGQKVILAYEPVWVIGSGQAVDHSIVEHIVQIILHTAIDLDSSFADKFQVIYGGSVDADNVNDFIIGNICTGVIVGNSSLKVDSFMDILDNIRV